MPPDEGVAIKIIRYLLPANKGLRFDAHVLYCLTMNTLTVRLPEELRSELDEISRTQEKPVSDVVRESLRRYVALERFRSLRKRVLPFAEAQGYLTDDDVFKDIS